jgi:hypothetical protein
MTSRTLRSILFLVLAPFAVACSNEPLGETGGFHPAGAVDAAAGQSPPTEEEWRTAMARAPLPQDGCFQASYPGGWRAVPCATPPDVALAPATAVNAGPPLSVGGGSGGYLSSVSGNISWAEGSFPVVKGVTSVTDGSADHFSLQLNSNRFNTSLCSGATCQGWQQFAYDQGSVFMQYWMLNYSGTCPSGWTGFSGHCYVNSSGSVSTPLLSARNLNHYVLSASAGTSDGVVLSTGNGNLYAYSQQSLFGLKTSWKVAEFNVFGVSHGSQAAFNAGSTVVVRIVTNSATPTTNAPACVTGGFTGETNNLTVVPSSCCPVGGAAPGIQFTESNVAGATAQACPFRLQTAAICGRSPTGLRCGQSNGTDFDEIALWTSDFGDPEWSFPQHYSTIQFPDVDGDGASDVCGRRSGGIVCAKFSNGKFGSLIGWSTLFSDASEGAFSSHYSTIRFPDVNGDGKADVCGRGVDGIQCALSTGSAFTNPTVWRSEFSDAAGWTAPGYYSTIAFPDLDGDGRADVCGRASGGLKCALSNGSTFGLLTNWAPVFADSNGWNAPQYYSTMKFPDLNGDGRADVCARASSGIKCALSNGSSFGAVNTWSTFYSDANGWDQPQHYATIVYGDLNGNGKVDVCGRNTSNYQCSLSTGTTFGPPNVWQTNLSDAAGWGVPECYSTLRLVDINHDGKADVCGRSSGGTRCAKSTGTAFGNLTIWDSWFSNAAGWSTEPYYSTISFLNE